METCFEDTDTERFSGQVQGREDIQHTFELHEIKETNDGDPNVGQDPEQVEIRW